VFVAGGRRHDRVLAPGAPGFVPLVRAPRIAAAFVALEDMRFRSHDGFDRDQIERAFWHNLVAGKVRRGASTISQQTARNLWLGVDRSLARKLQEAWLTARLEATVEKDRILELYMNLIELGPGVFGIDDGARHHFGLAPRELDVLQALHLASLAPAPRTLSKRFASGQVDDAWLTELREHARRMHRNGMISEDELMVALRSDLRLRVHAVASADAAP
jgi:membrane peptidoglycan carboxypeptidase